MKPDKYIIQCRLPYYQWFEVYSLPSINGIYVHLNYLREKYPNLEFRLLKVVDVFND